MKRIGLLIFITMTCVIWANTLPEISNLSIAQRTDGSMLIDVYYDVLDADMDTLTVNMQASEDGGETWTVSCDSIMGDIGENIVSGAGKQIIWNFGAEHPGFFSEELKVRLLADDHFYNITDGWAYVSAGEFTWGENDEIQTIDYDYEIMKYEVTNIQYLSYLEEAFAAGDIEVTTVSVSGYYEGDANYAAGDYVFYDLDGSGRISWDGSNFNIQEGYENHPVVEVSWFGSYAYAEYYGWRLPTEQEWEKAARGMTGYEYSWGNVLSGERANYMDSGYPWDNGTTPVGYYNGENGTIDTPSAYGCYDMCGNVNDWTDSWYGGYYSYRVLRGGSWYSYSFQDYLRSWHRTPDNPTYTFFSIGFRCARTVGVNAAPDMPDNPSPENGMIDVPVNTSLSWECSDPEGDELSYDVYFGEIPELDISHLLAEDIMEASWVLENLNINTAYYWKITASDGEFETEGEVWNFTTIEEGGMVLVEGGTFEMGDHFIEGGGDELPVHEITLNGFYIGQYEVTQAEYAAVMGSNPAHDWGVGDNYPVYYVSWYDALEYCNAMSIQENLTPCYDLSDWSCDFSADGYRLPTEAEWEYAARGGVNWTDNYRYSGTTDNLGYYAWYGSNSSTQTQEVGTKLPNQLDIYEMSGNVFEWCNDWYSSSYYGSSPANNPTGPDSGSYRVVRGGSWHFDANGCRVATRNISPPGGIHLGVGFRILRAYTCENTAPEIPDNPYPANGGLDVSVNTSLSWECSDPEGDELSYDVYFGEIPELDVSHLVAEDIMEEAWVLENLNINTTYYWKIIASDGEFETEGEVCSFTTIEEEQIDGMIFVQGGTFEMGDHFNEGYDYELPVHDVTLNSFYIGQYEVTQGEYESLIYINPAHNFGVGDNYPVYYVTWYNALEYCNALSDQEGLTWCYDLSDWSCDFSADGYRLPTEAEWEYASRGGVNWEDDFRYSGTTDNLGDYVVYSENDPGHSEVVGSKLPNQLDIYDMSGNVWEWCNDWYSSSYYSSSPANNPTGPDSGSFRLKRGGSWRYDAFGCRVAYRYINYPGSSGDCVGFRILRAIE